MRDRLEGVAHLGTPLVPTCGAQPGNSYIMIMIMILSYGTCKQCVFSMSLLSFEFMWNKRCFTYDQIRFYQPRACCRLMHNTGTLLMNIMVRVYVYYSDYDQTILAILQYNDVEVLIFSDFMQKFPVNEQSFICQF